MKGSALVVVDLVNDFITGVFGSPHAKDVADRASGVASRASASMPVIFTMDSHIEGDPEFQVWPEHCVRGTEGAELYGELSTVMGHRVPKRHFDSFQDSDLDGLLRALGVEHVYLCGISTDICVLHTAAGAFFRYYGITVVEDLCAAIDQSRHSRALEDMKANYGVRVISSEDFLRSVE